MLTFDAHTIYSCFCYSTFPWVSVFVLRTIAAITWTSVDYRGGKWFGHLLNLCGAGEQKKYTPFNEENPNENMAQKYTLRTIFQSAGRTTIATGWKWRKKKWENIDMENEIVVETMFRSINVCTSVLFCLTERTRRGTQQIMLVQYSLVKCLYVPGEAI